MNRQNWKHWLIGGLAMTLLLCHGAPSRRPLSGLRFGRLRGRLGRLLQRLVAGLRLGRLLWRLGSLSLLQLRLEQLLSALLQRLRLQLFCRLGRRHSRGNCEPVVATSSPSPASTPPASADPGSGSKTTVASTDSSGTLTISVPSDAKVTINDRETRSTGSRRQFVSYGLTPGLVYTYVVRARWSVMARCRKTQRRSP